MSHSDHRSGGSGASLAEEDEQVRVLIEGAGPLPEVPAADLAAIKQAFRAEWERQVLGRRAGSPGERTAGGWSPGEPGPGQRSSGERSVLRWFPVVDRRLLALAAVLVAALGLGWWLARQGSPAPALPLARIESISGVVTAILPQGEGEAKVTRLAVGQEIPAGAGLETGIGEAEGAGQAALRLAEGASLRLDAGSRVRLVSASLVRLERGALYVDSGREPGAAGRGEPLAVHTALGVATEVGTQFEVRLLPADSGAMRVRVREGEVRIDDSRAGAGTSYSAPAGTELTLHADGSVGRQPIAGHGPAWGWVLAAAPPLAIEGLTVAELLAWVSRETGWQVRYADPALAAKAGPIAFRGSVGRLTPEQAPELLASAGLAYEVVDGVLIVRPGSEPE